MQLSYNLLGEVASCFFSAILFYNVISTFSPYEKKQVIFLYAIVGNFVTTLFDIISVLLMEYGKNLPNVINYIATTLYFITILVVPAMMCVYAIEVSFSRSKNKNLLESITIFIYISFIFIVIANIWTGWIFHFDKFGNYYRGPLKYSTYAYVIIFMTIIEFSVFSHRKAMATRLFLVFVLYPLVSISLLSIQFKFTNLIMTGAASFAALLLAYITIQSEMIDYDMNSGLLSENKLKKYIEAGKKTENILVISIDNMDFIQNNMDNSNFNQLQLDIGREFLLRFERNAYHISTNRFAAISDNLNELKAQTEEIYTYIRYKHCDVNLKIPAPLEVYSAIIDLSQKIESTNDKPTIKGHDSKSYNDVIEIINNLLKKAKLDGLQTTAFCDETALLMMKRKNMIYEILKRELTPDSTQFQVWYQPIYSIKEHKFTYMEALSRLRNTELGDINPGEFVAVAEERGLIEQLGFVAFNKVCQFIAANKNLVNGVSINFSGYQMTNPKIVEIVLSTINEYELNPSSIIMEITESIFIENSSLVNENMKRLSNAGVRFYLDDFGTGYSNLANVIGLNFSTIKMDRTLVLMLEQNERNLKFFMNIVNTFKNAGFNILTEGVETQSQSALVQSAGTDYIQGFLFSKPLPPKDCIALLRKQEEGDLFPVL